MSIKVLEDIKKINNNGVEPGHVLIAGRTQNPSAAKFLVRQLGLFPQPGRDIDPAIQRIGKKLVKSVHHENPGEYRREVLFDEKYFIERGAYQGVTQLGHSGVYPLGIPYCHDDEINLYMKKYIDWINGDALFLLGYFKENIINRIFEESKKHMVLCGIYERDLERSAAIF